MILDDILENGETRRLDPELISSCLYYKKFGDTHRASPGRVHRAIASFPTYLLVCGVELCLHVTYRLSGLVVKAPF
jgi:hypothetical protein